MKKSLLIEGANIMWASDYYNISVALILMWVEYFLLQLVSNTM
jgi:hypothetical protein